jgi:hypothetical protein
MKPESVTILLFCLSKKGMKNVLAFRRLLAPKREPERLPKTSKKGGNRARAAEALPGPILERFLLLFQPFWSLFSSVLDPFSMILGAISVTFLFETEDFRKTKIKNRRAPRPAFHAFSERLEKQSTQALPGFILVRISADLSRTSSV